MVFFFRTIEDDWTNVCDENLSVNDGRPQSNDRQKTKNTDGLIAQTYKFIQIIWHEKFKNMLNIDCFYYKQANFTI